jgi:predicted nucleic acid-binding protein
MKDLLDVNALVALGFLQHEFHERVAAWVRTWASKGALELATCSITELGFVRVLAQAPHYGFTVAHARTLLLRLKTGNSLKFTFITDDQDVSHLPAWVKNRETNNRWSSCATRQSQGRNPRHVGPKLSRSIPNPCSKMKSSP